MKISLKISFGFIPATVGSIFLTRQDIAQEKLYPNMLPLKDITLLEEPFKHAIDLNIGEKVFVNFAPMLFQK